ncbi:hypothetical protein OEA41_010597 [Lepraria neglecta]|uniref:Uncharacterized protein n=1 Tax=Lepraria neglecta TaxID=209136 RepID=A0AAE0DFQ4_9LECA|nr:hypothetical protein OEA41_010597 [Lepraria neglecta]
MAAILCGACQAIFKSWNHPVTKGSQSSSSMREIRQQQPRGGSLSYKMLKYFSKHRKKPHHLSFKHMQAAAQKGCEICNVLCDRWEYMEPNVRLSAMTELEELQSRSHGGVLPSEFLRLDTYATWEEEERDWHHWWRVTKFTVLYWQYHPTFSVCRKVQLEGYEYSILEFQFGNGQDDMYRDSRVTI